MQLTHVIARLPALVAITALSLGLAACSSHSDYSGPSPFIVDADPNQMDAVLADASVSCRDLSPESCPSGVGLLAMFGELHGEKGYGQCTAFLIDERTAMTNSHCIPDEVKDDGKSCKGRMRMVFPNTANESETSVGCEKLIMASKIRSEEQQGFGEDSDYAVIRLDAPVKRKIYKLSRAGLPDGFALRVLSIDPVSKTAIRGEMHVRTCVSVQKSGLAPGYRHPFHPVASFTNCPIIQGNSGSPAIDESGLVRAVAYAVKAEAAAQAQTKKSNFALPPMPAKFNAMTLMANVACVDFPSASKFGLGPISDSCSTTISREQAFLEDTIPAKQEAFAEKFSLWSQTSDAAENFVFTLKPRESHQYLMLGTPEIRCARVDRLEQSFGRESESRKNGPWMIETSFETPVWALAFVPDADYRTIPVEYLFTSAANTISFDLATLAKEQRVAATVRYAFKGESPADLKFDLRACTTED